MTKKDAKLPISAKISPELKKKMMRDIETSRPKVSQNAIIEAALENYYDDKLIEEENLKHNSRNL